MCRIAYPPSFVSSVKRLDECLRFAKLQRCPHCKQSGTLIGHGFLRGYAEHGSELALRGRRLLCSNRLLRSGCGRTVVILLDWILPRFSVRAPRLFEFAKAVIGGASRRAAWLATATGGMALATGYRLWQQLQASQSYLRTLLSALSSPPKSLDALEPWAQLLEHFAAEFGEFSCPFSAMQSRLQRPLLPRSEAHVRRPI